MAEVDRSAATNALSAMQDEFPRARPVRSPPSGSNSASKAGASSTNANAASSQSASLLDAKLLQEQKQTSSARDAESEEKRERAVRAGDAGEAKGGQGAASKSRDQHGAGVNITASGSAAQEPPSTPAAGLAGSPPIDNATNNSAAGRSKPDRGFKLDNFPGNDNKQRDQRGYSFGESRNSTRDMLLTPARDDMPFNMSPRS